MKELESPAFYCVMVEGQGRAKRPHATLELATTEAERLRAEGEHCKGPIYVLSATHVLPSTTLTLKKKSAQTQS